MFVTACDRAYLLFTKAWARSLIRNGCIPQSKIIIIAFGNDKHEADLIELDIRREFKQVHIVKIGSRAKEFRFIENQRSDLRVFWFSDYIRAWIGKELHQYIWMDSDIIIKKNANPLLKMMDSTSTIAMARETKVRGFKGTFYYMSYVKCFKDAPTVYHDSSGVPLVMNCGVIISDRDYSKEWKNVFEQVVNLMPKKAVKRREDIGQVVWNLLFWKNRGKILSPRFNSYSNLEHRNAMVVHYDRPLNKPALLRAICKQRLA